jgi:hypothetical protein
LAVRTPNRVFLSHSLPKAARLEAFDPAILECEATTEPDLRPGGSIYALVWGRDRSTATVERFLEKVEADWLITGHIPCDRGFDLPNDRQVIVDCTAAPACFCLFPIDRPLSHQKLVECIGTL